MGDTATLNTKVSTEEKRTFAATAEALGMNSSTALKVFVKKFNECGGFPFEVRKRNPNIPENIRRDMMRTEAAMNGYIPDDSYLYEPGQMPQSALDALGLTKEELGL